MGAKKRKRENTNPAPARKENQRRLGIWRKKGSVFITLSGEAIRDKAMALNASIRDEQWLQSVGGRLRIPPQPAPGSCLLEDWGLPHSVSNSFARHGIKSLYSWQEECLQKISSTTSISSAIYSAPTSGGKSLVADILMIRRLLFEGRRALILCPFVSICKERSNFLRSVLQPLGIVVEEFHGPVGKPWHPGVDVAVCTVQKGISILHRIVGNELDDDESEDSQKSEDPGAREFSKYIGTVIVDEFHLSCEQRGSVMESFVSRLGQLEDRSNILLIGMSATLPEKSQEAISRWLQPCLMFKCNFRPIELSVVVKRGSRILPVLPATLHPRELSILYDPRTDNDHFASLVHESVERSKSTIIFCATRNWCENACTLLTKMFNPVEDRNLIAQRTEILEALKLLSPSGVHPGLAASLLQGIAFHHAGLTSEERTIIETGFRAKSIVVLCATSTLSAGVNLPAERVILRTLTAASGGTAVTNARSVSAKVKQMVGRAGRAGHAASGEAIIMCSSDKEESIVREIFSPTSVEDDFTLASVPEDPKWIAKEILETISFLGKTKIEYFLREFARSKLLLKAEVVRDAIQFLLKSKLVNMGDQQQSLMPTVIGDALAHSSLPTDEAESVFKELSQARHKLCLSGDDLHLLFLVTPPVNVSETEFEEFTANSDLFLEKNVRAILGDQDTVARRKRMMVALMLRDLTSGNESLSSISAVSKKFKVQTGTVQYLQSNAATYCAMVSSFCERLQWTSLSAALNTVKPRLHFGVSDELLPLVQVEGISPASARALARAGYMSVKKIAKATPLDIALVLARSAVTTDQGQKLLDLTSSMIVNNARTKLGWSPLTQSSTSSYDLFPSISAPVLMQLIGTQRIESDVEEAAEEEIEFPATLTQQTDPLLDPEEDALLASALRLIDTAPPRRRLRRISEMTTIEAGMKREFDIPSNNTGDDEDAMILRAIDFNALDNF